MPVISNSTEGTVPVRAPADSSRLNAVAAGVLLIVATAASLMSGPFLAPVTDPGVLGNAAAHQSQVAVGVLLGFTAALAAPGIAVALYPVLRNYGQGLALGSVAFRIIEGVFYAVGLLLLLSLSSLSQAFVAAGEPAEQHYDTLGQTMVAQYHWLVDVGLLLAFSVGGLLYYLVFFRSRLIPRWLSAWGILGVALLMVAAVLLVFGVITPLGPVQVALAVPIGLQEMVLAVWLIAKGFDRSVLAQRPS